HTRTGQMDLTGDGCAIDERAIAAAQILDVPGRVITANPNVLPGDPLIRNAVGTFAAPEHPAVAIDRQWAKLRLPLRKHAYETGMRLALFVGRDTDARIVERASRPRHARNLPLFSHPEVECVPTRGLVWRRRQEIWTAVADSVQRRAADARNHARRHR